MPRRGRVAAWVAFTLLAVHVVDESFVQPRAGTSASDHLASALIPVAILVIAATIAGQSRAGVAATIAVVFGSLGVIAGAVDATQHDGRVLLSAPAGLALLFIGVASLWNNRRRDETVARRTVRRLLLAAVAIGCAFLFLYPLGLSYVATHAGRRGVPPPALGAPY